MKSLWYVLIGCLSLFIVLAKVNAPRPERLNMAQPIHEAQTSGNKAHDQLMNLSSRDQSHLLGQVAGCVGRRSFYMGMHPKTSAAYWSVGCADGHSYQVEIAADSKGTSSFADCSLLKAVGVDYCFHKLEGSK
jgi:hypothetical protein